MHNSLKFAEALTLEAGEIILKHFQPGIAFETKEDDTPVTKADKEVNALVIQRIREAYPDHSVLGEEESFDNHSPFMWLCDPIDGTHPYTKGIPVSVFSLALVHEGYPIIAVVYDPYTKSLYSAEKGKGAFLNGQPTHVSDRQPSQATINIEWWKGAEYDVDTALHNFSQETGAYVLKLGSVIQGACLVAGGQFEACVFPGTKGKSIDIAAVKLIVEEAGGKVTDIHGNDQRYDALDIKGALITNRLLHEPLLEALKNV